MKRTQRQYLADILEAMTAAGQFVEGKEREDLEADLRSRWALEQACVVIGEMVEEVDSGLKARYPQISWRDMVDTRDRLVREYWAANLKAVWDTIHKRFPQEKPMLQRVLDELPPEEV